MRVGNLNPKRDALAADTALCHWLHLLATLKLLAKHADAILADFGEKSFFRLPVAQMENTSYNRSKREPPLASGALNLDEVKT